MSKLTEEEITDARFYAKYNSLSVRYSDNCGCYSCLEKFKAKLVVDYKEDDTAKCPKCGKSTVIPDLSMEISKEVLRQIKKGA